MGMPNISIVFKQLGITAVQRSEKGVLAMILVDAAGALQGGHVLTSAAEIATKLSTLGVDNKETLSRAFTGYIYPPRKIIVYIIDGEETTLETALNYFATQQFDYLVGPPDIDSTDAAAIALWIKSERLNDHMAKAVLPSVAADHEGIVNFATDAIMAGETEYTASEFCSRIAGLIAGTPMTISATYAPLPEVTDCTRLTKADMDDAVDAGKFIIWHDGKQVLTGRAVNSLVTTSQEKGSKFQKIKIVEIMDMIKNDIGTTARQSYIGKYANSYDNKCLLITAIKGYLEGLELGGLLARGASTVAINMAKQEAYLKDQGKDTSTMTEQEIKEADTDSIVFLEASIRILDAIEDITLDFTI